jgi:hypothetical protein
MHNSETWYCVFCGSQLTDAPGYLYCALGDCGFSQSIADKFVAGRQNKMTPDHFAGGKPMRWRCPGCAQELLWGTVNNAPVFGCSSCGLFLPAGAQHQLLHYHAHKDFG